MNTEKKKFKNYDSSEIDALEKQSNLDQEYKTQDNFKTQINEDISSVRIIDKYESLSLDKLLLHAQKLLKNNDIYKVGYHFEAIRSIVKKKFEEDRVKKLNKFIYNGEKKENFIYNNDLAIQFKILLTDYRKKKNEHYTYLKKIYSENLEKKTQIINDLKSLYQDPNLKINIFDEFRKIQRRWNTSGQIAKSKMFNINKTYYHHLENFFDFLDLSREAREKDFQSHLEQKLVLIKKAEKLSEETNIYKAVNELKYLHKIWKEEIGPVAKEHRKEIWQRFKIASDIIYKKKKDYLKALDKQKEINYKMKFQLCENILKLEESEKQSHFFWQKQLIKYKELQKSFHSIGPVPHNKNKDIWNLYKENCRAFNKKRNEFYKNLKTEQKENYKKKMELVLIAESLQNSINFNDNVNRVKKIQSDWKKIGFVPHNKSKTIWKRFNTACNVFFENYNKHSVLGEIEILKNQENKQNILDKFEKIELPNNNLEALKTLKSFQNQWLRLGKISQNNLQLNEKFFSLLHYKLSKNDATQEDIVLSHFAKKISDHNGDFKKISKEEKALKNKIAEKEKDLHRTTTNLGYFSSNSEDSPMMLEIKEKIEIESNEIKILQNNLNFLLNIKTIIFGQCDKYQKT